VGGRLIINGKMMELPSYWSMLKKNNPLTYKVKYPYIVGGDVILEADPFLGHDIKSFDTRWKVPIWKWRENNEGCKLPLIFDEMVEYLNPSPPPPPPPPPRTYLDDRDHIGMAKAIFIEFLMKRINFLTKQRT